MALATSDMAYQNSALHDEKSVAIDMNKIIIEIFFMIERYLIKCIGFVAFLNILLY